MKGIIGDFMFCMNCGEQLPDGAVFCSKCGSKIDSNIATNKTEENEKEKIIIQGLCNRIKSRFLTQNGNAMLTNKRFVYLKHSLAKTLVAGVFVNLTKGSYDFDIPIEEIASIEDSRQGVSKTIIIHTKSGEKYHFYFTKREEWKIHLQNAMNQGSN